MGEDINKRYIEPIVNASRPGTLAALSMSILKFSTEDPLILQITLIVGAILFLLSSFFIFFFTIYPTRRILWTGTAVSFFMGLICSISASIMSLMYIQ